MSTGLMFHHGKRNPVGLSIGILVCDDDDVAIRDALASLFRQSVFEKIGARHEQCEILVIAHAGAEQTITAARRVFDAMERRHPWTDAFTARVIEIPECGRAHAWNRFVHEFSAVEARFLCFMDAGIALHHRDTVHNLMAILQRKSHVPASTSRDINALILKEHRTLAERFALAQSALVRAGTGKLCEQLYCLRASVARSLFLPGDLAGAEVDFINEVVRTEFFTRDSNRHRVVLAPEAAHLCEPRTGRGAILERYRRRAMGRAALHVLLEHVKALAWEDRFNLAEALRRRESQDPEWLKKLIAAHLRRRPFFWQLFPGALTLRFKQLFALPGLKKLTHLPAACAGFFLTLAACADARRLWRRRMLPPATAAQSGELAPASRARAA